MNRVFRLLIFEIVFFLFGCNTNQHLKQEQAFNENTRKALKEIIDQAPSHESQQQNQMENVLMVDPIKPTVDTDFLEELPENVTVPEDMLFIPGGEFTEKDGNFNRDIKIKGFLIDKNPVSLKEFATFMESENFDVEQLKKYNSTHLNSIDHEVNDHDSNSVVLLSWYEANAYCKSLGKRLPNENEWKHTTLLTQRRNALKEFNYSKMWEWTNNWQLNKGEDLNTFVPDAYSKKIILSFVNEKKSQIEKWQISSVKPKEKQQNLGCRCVKEIQLKY